MMDGHTAAGWALSSSRLTADDWALLSDWLTARRVLVGDELIVNAHDHSELENPG